MKKICIVYLLVGSDLLPIFINSIKSLRKVDDKIDVVVYAKGTICVDLKNISNLYKFNVISLDSGSTDKTYSEFGSADFNKTTRLKWDIILHSFELGYETVVYSDADIAFINLFSSYISAVSRHYKIGVQSESQPSWYPSYCTGFMFFTHDFIVYIKQISDIHKSSLDNLNDQDVFNTVISDNPFLVKEVFLLPESLFPNGLHYKNFKSESFNIVGGQLSPFIFHANWVKGIDHKIKLLKHVGLWLD